ncbi:MAG: DUF362 domain-containing protein [Actinobacteria bacterium]|jgi:uncharacterized protein (DUF362 family)|nr:MAG: DUF362 domain-containing protein [Actinomycetota bacterium]
MSRVAVARVGEDIASAVEEALAPFGGIRDVLGKKKDVFIKVNAVDYKSHSYTYPAVVTAVARLFKAAGARNVYVMENCTQAAFTRLVFRITGLDKAAKAAGAVPLYLDEGKQVEIALPTLGYNVHVSRWVKERLIDGRDENLYFSLPKLKTHSMGTVTLGVKNQFGLIMQEDRIRDHNYNLHRKFADIYAVIRPDFTLIEGVYAMNHGHDHPEGLVDRCAERLDVLIGGDDTLAVDAVGCDIMGIRPSRVEHLRLAAEGGWGTIDLDEIEVIGDREPFRREFTHQILDIYPDDVRIIEGKERCCPEGCSLNTRMVLQYLYVDFQGKGGFTIVMGKGLDPAELQKLEGRVFIVGDCAYEEAYSILSHRLDRKALRVCEGCNNLRDVLAGLTPFMDVNPLKMVPLPALESLGLLINARLHRTTARITPLIPR